MPWLANSNLPGLCWMAPVKAPVSKPNSSDSSSSVGSAAQFTFTNGLSWRSDGGVQRARDQFLAGAALAADQHGDVRVGDTLDELLHLGHPLRSPPKSSVCLGLPAQLLAQQRHLAASACRCLSAVASGASRSSSSNGLLTKSVAPSFIACTTVAVRPWPEMTMTGTSWSICLERRERREPIHRARQDHVEEHRGWSLLA